jgi:short-subunit dehydrogenase
MDYQNILLIAACIILTVSVLLLLNRQWLEQSYTLSNKVILLTGGSRGLGLVMARQLLQAGARLAICARDEAELQRTRTELEQQGEVLALTCDVTNQAQVEQMVQQVQQRFGVIDILINNAGADIVGPLENLTIQDYDDLIKLHFWAPLYTSYAILPQMQQRKSGRIVNISSIGGKVVSPHMVAYCASKFALVGLSESMRTELARTGIAVTTVCPGFIRTGVIEHAIMKGQNRKEFAWFSIGDSLPLISTSAERVARATIAGLRRGDAEVIVPFPAWLATKFYALFPGFTSNLLSFANRLLPKPGGIGQERAFGADSHSSWSPSWLTALSNRAAQRNNEIPVAEPKGTTEVKPVEPEEQPQAVVNATSVSVASAESLSVEDDQSGFPLVDPAEASPEVQACLSDIQDTLGIPWVPANWRAYAIHPAVIQLFWERLKPVTQTEPFLEDAIAITEHVYRDINDWYQPTYQVDVEKHQQRQIQRELNAFTFGNPQLLIQQVALSRTLAGEVVGQDGHADARRGPNAYRHSNIQLLSEQSAQKISPEMQQVYRDIKQTLGVPIVNSDYQALAHWTAFFLAAWEDIKQWRDRPEYQLLKQTVIQRAEEAAARLRPAVVIGEQEVRDRLDSPEDYQQIQQSVQMFRDILPELIIQDSLFHMGLSTLSR